MQMLTEIGALARQLVRSSMDAAEGADLQRSRVAKAAAMERQIRAAAGVSLESSKTAVAATQELATGIDAGTETVVATNRNMSDMVERVTAGADLMQEFVARMQEVQRIVGEIDEIARQTNLLALNAAIEAVHAGSAGDGFSVIAHEIRLLADRAGNSNREIADKIEAMTKSANAAGKAMQLGRVAATASIAENVQVQRSLETMREAAHKLKDLSHQVQEASEEQIRQGEELAASMEEVEAEAPRASMDADAAAEVSIQVVTLADHANAGLRGWSPAEHARRNLGRRLTDGVLSQVEEHRLQILGDLDAFRAECFQLGSPTIRGAVQLGGVELPGLCFGARAVSDLTSLVDGVHDRTRCGVTVFVRDGEEFVRVVTTVKRPDGGRAVGTKLNPKGVAIVSLREGKRHFGVVYILAHPVVAGYEPLFGPDKRVIGALYVGLPLTKQ